MFVGLQASSVEQVLFNSFFSKIWFYLNLKSNGTAQIQVKARIHCKVYTTGPSILRVWYEYLGLSYLPFALPNNQVL